MNIADYGPPSIPNSGTNEGFFRRFIRRKPKPGAPAGHHRNLVPHHTSEPRHDWFQARPPAASDP